MGKRAGPGHGTARSTLSSCIAHATHRLATVANPRCHSLHWSSPVHDSGCHEVGMLHRNSTVLLPLLFTALASGATAQQTRTPLEAFFNVASPLELTAAKRADRIAWTVYEAGLRNVYTAAAPDFTPVRLTSFVEDDGQEVSGVRLSDDGSIAVFVRGHAPNRDGWIANPMHDPAGSERAIWAVRTSGGSAWRLAGGSARSG